MMLILLLMLLTTTASSATKMECETPVTGRRILRCENDEDIFYSQENSISCKIKEKKETKKKVAVPSILRKRYGRCDINPYHSDCIAKNGVPKGFDKEIVTPKALACAASFTKCLGTDTLTSKCFDTFGACISEEAK